MSRFKVTVEYEGTRFSGWQIQKNARTIQGEVVGALKSILKTDQFEFYGSGRTDAGVHALEQVAHLDAQTMLAPHILRMKINDLLPADINILNVEKTTNTFHARHNAIARSYLYQISRRRTAFGKRYVWWIKDTLDIGKMVQTANLFLGMKNFESFTADDPDDKSTKSFIEEIVLKEAGDLIFIRITGSHFLWKMVRQIIGVVAEVGRGKLSIEEVQHYLVAPSGEPAKLTAPPSGLFLEKVFYKGDKRLSDLVPVMKI